MRVPQKWRPSLGLLIAVVVGFLVTLPIVALVGARVTSNQFVRETEANLHAQAAIYAALYAQAFSVEDPDPEYGAEISQNTRERLLETFHPIDPGLVANSGAILPPRPDPLETDLNVTEAHQAVGDMLSNVAADAKKTTLIGFLALDHQGQVIAASGSDLGSFAHVSEVADALSGEITSVARWRTEEYRNHSVRSISRDTKFRVFVAHPVIVGDRVVGIVYLSRTPSNLNLYLFQQRHIFLWLLAGVALSATLVGLFLWRFLTHPLRGLTEQAVDIASGNSRERLPAYGAKEIAILGQSIMDMGASLQKQSAAMETYTKHATHELKSPVTSIIAAAELLEDDVVADDRRLNLAGTIKSDGERMDRLLQRMRGMVRGRTGFDTKPVNLKDAVEDIRKEFPKLIISLSSTRHISLLIVEEALKICLRHLLENAQEHEATRVEIGYDAEASVLTIDDNGTGFSPANLKTATDPFFTTKRDRGGTGLGLSICVEIVEQFNAHLSVANTDYGARVSIEFRTI